MTFYVFFEITYQKVIKSLYQKFSPQSVEISSQILLKPRLHDTT